MNEKKAIVVIPTTGSDELLDAIQSVQHQTYKPTHLLIVTDGPQYSSNVSDVLKKCEREMYEGSIFRCDLPFNTGGGGFYGHRIMAAFSHLVPDYSYVLFLDQDNWFDPDHVESQIKKIEVNKWDWAYSLRKVYDKDKNYIANDNCESLGPWPVWVDKNSFLIDTSSYCFKTEFIKHTGHLWDHGWGADRRFYTILKDQFKHTNYGCSEKYTLNYRLGGNENSVQKDFFTKGNEMMERIYGTEFPWTGSKKYITINY